jgi:hypothetical protein
LIISPDDMVVDDAVLDFGARHCGRHNDGREADRHQSRTKPEHGVIPSVSG